MNNAPTAKPTDETIQAAYFYLMGRVYAIQQEHVDIQKTPYNTIKYNPLGSASADFVNPNMDVAYLEAWIAMDDTHAVVMNVPEIKGRYYTVQIMDGWGEVIANVNERNYPQHPFGKVAFVKKGTNPSVPPDALVIELPSEKAKILARVELSTTPDTAVALQHAFTLNVPEGIRIEAPPRLPPLQSPHLPGAWIFDNVQEVLASCPDSMPDALKLQQMAREVAAYAAQGAEAKAYLQDNIDNKLTPYFFKTLVEGRPARGGWMITDFGGRFGNNYEYRALVNFGGIWANVPEEAVYYTIHKDATGETITGSGSYTLHFAADALPETACNAFWSVTLLRLPDYRAVPNPLDRFTINNVSGAKKGADGSLTLYIAPEQPTGAPQENWLPTPKGTPITMSFRVYVPKENTLNKEWFVPPLERAD